MSSALASIPIPARRRVAATVGAAAALALLVGLLAATSASVSGLVRGLGVVAILAAAALAFVAWGVAHSVRVDRAEQALDAAIEQTVRHHGGQLCDCDHPHDPDELHVTDNPCAHDGAGTECTHTCETCVLQTLRR